jgi:hypothetical protein
MEKINYGYIFQKNYPDCEWSVLPARKGYEYDAYVWSPTNNISKPAKLELDIAWQTLKRSTWLWEQVIKERDQKLCDSDRYVLPDYPHATEEVRQAWLDYRQALRDFTVTANPTVNQNNEIEVEWPTKPI